MRIPVVRFTVRRLMVAVAILIGIGLQIRRTIRFSRLSAGFAQLAAMYAEDESYWRGQERYHCEHGGKLRKLAVDPQQRNGAEFWSQYAEREAKRAEQIKAVADYNAIMKAKCEARARRPWIDVDPDPPRPEL